MRPGRTPSPKTRRAKKRKRGASSLTVIALAFGFCLSIVTGTAQAGYVIAARMFDDTRPDCEFIRIVDGETLLAQCYDTGFEQVRIIGLDMPRLLGAQCGAEIGAALIARWTLQRKLLATNEVKMIYTSRREDDLRVVRLIIGGRDATREMLKSSFAQTERDAARLDWC